LGDTLRAAMQQTLERVASIRTLCGFNDENLEFDVRGFNFEDKLEVEDVGVIGDVLALDIPSDTFEREIKKKVAATALPDLNPATRQKINDEIDAAPPQAERDIQKQLAQAEATRKQVAAEMGQAEPEGIAA
jgi:hypothetical protein